MATLVRYNNFPTFFNPFYSRPVINRYHNTTPNVPAVNVKENETGFFLELAAPGLKKAGFENQRRKQHLTIGYQPEDKPKKPPLHLPATSLASLRLNAASASKNG